MTNTTDETVTDWTCDACLDVYTQGDEVHCRYDDIVLCSAECVERWDMGADGDDGTDGAWDDPAPTAGREVELAGMSIADTQPATFDALPIMPAAEEWNGLCQMAAILCKSGLVTSELRHQPANVLLVLLVGRSLDLAPTTALASLYVIDGRVTLPPKIRLGLLHNAKKGTVRPIEMSPTTVTGEAVDATGQVLERRTYTYAEAPAELKHKSNWQNYPARMLWWRLCLPDHAEAMTPHGWVRHEKLGIGDKILGFNQSSSHCEWVTVDAVNVFEDQPLVRSSHSRFAMTSTPDHRWITDSSRHPGQWEFRTTAQLSAGEQRRILTAAPLGEWGVPDEDEIRDAAIMGWMLTDGSWMWRGNSPTGQISQTKHVDVCRELLRGIPHAEDVIGPRTRTIRGETVHTRESHQFRLSAPVLRNILARFGVVTKSDAALIPAQLSRPAADAMWEAMMFANGINGAAFITGHRAVMDAFQMLAAMRGVRLGIERNVGRDSDTWRVSVQQNPLASNKRLVYTDVGTGRVWCPTTSSGTWVTRLDGQVTITGNCGWMLDDHFPEIGLGLYSPDELGAITDGDGVPITPSNVALPVGYADETRTAPSFNIEERNRLARKVLSILDTDGGAQELRPQWATAKLPKVADMVADSDIEMGHEIADIVEETLTARATDNERPFDDEIPTEEEPNDVR